VANQKILQMVIGVFGRKFEDRFCDSIEGLFDLLLKEGFEVVVYEKFYNFLIEKINLPKSYKLFKTHQEVAQLDILLSIGGDGTILDTINYIRDSNVPVLGINVGRLGFLSTVSLDEIPDAIACLKSENFTIDSRSLIKIESEAKLGEFNYALNEVTIHRKDTSSMITVNVWVDGNFISTYWADGLIVSTPTGSTAYSLSCGGPITMPHSENLIITPIAPHNLNVRPLVIPNSGELKLQAKGRDESFLLSMDSYSYSIDGNTEIFLSNASFKLNLITLPGHNFFNAIRNKLMWGADKRN